MAVSGLGCEKPLAGAGWGHTFVLSMNGPGKQSSHFVAIYSLQFQC